MQNKQKILLGKMKYLCSIYVGSMYIEYLYTFCYLIGMYVFYLCTPTIRNKLNCIFKSQINVINADVSFFFKSFIITLPLALMQSIAFLFDKYFCYLNK